VCFFCYFVTCRLTLCVYLPFDEEANCDNASSYATTFQHEFRINFMFIYLLKINDRRTRGSLIRSEVHKDTQK